MTDLEFLLQKQRLAAEVERYCFHIALTIIFLRLLLCQSL